MTRLILVARLRSLGWVPWILLAGWLLFSFYQEPRFLRRFDIYLVDDALWSGCLVVLLILLLTEPVRVRAGTWLANLLIVAATSLLFVLLSVLFQGGHFDRPIRDHLLGGLWFLLAWGPFGLLLATSRHSHVFHISLLLICLILASMQADVLRTSSRDTVFLSIAFSWSAVVTALVIGSRKAL